MDLVAFFLRKPARMSHLLERIPENWAPGKRRACQSLLFGTVRHVALLEKALDEFIRRRPKPQLWAALLVSSRELMEQPERSPKIVHNAVREIGKRFSKAEKGLANAVLRKVVARIPELLDEPLSAPADLCWRYSHPRWLVDRWLEQFGWEETVAFLQWNQEESAVFARWQRDTEEVTALSPCPNVEGFFKLDPGAWAEISPFVEAGRLYVQNPAASLAPKSLAKAAPIGRWLDLCAAPGGKGLLLEQLSGPDLAEIISVDLPGPRFERMESNFHRYGAKKIRALPADVLKLESEKLGLFEGVLLDAPCSNSGVLQHKIDARWRQSPDGLEDLLALQAELLDAASGFVAEGGALVYSTCSVDSSENDGIIDGFLAKEKGKLFELETSEVSLPWKQGRDGAGIFVLRKKAGA